MCLLILIGGMIRGDLWWKFDFSSYALCLKLIHLVLGFEGTSHCFSVTKRP